MDENTRAFLLAEFELLSQLRNHHIETYTSQVSSFFTLVTATGGGFAVFASSGLPSRTDTALALGCLGSLLTAASLLLGLRGIDNQIQTRVYIRGLNLIRGAFAEGNVTIQNSLVMPTDGSFPPFTHIGYNRGFRRGMVGESLGLTCVLYSVTVGAFSWLAADAFLSLNDSYLIGSVFTLAVVSLIGSFMYVRRHAENEFKLAEANQHWSQPVVGSSPSA